MLLFAFLFAAQTHALWFPEAETTVVLDTYSFCGMFLVEDSNVGCFPVQGEGFLMKTTPERLDHDVLKWTTLLKKTPQTVLYKPCTALVPVLSAEHLSSETLAKLKTLVETEKAVFHFVLFHTKDRFTAAPLLLDFLCPFSVLKVFGDRVLAVAEKNVRLLRADAIPAFKASLSFRADNSVFLSETDNAPTLPVVAELFKTKNPRAACFAEELCSPLGNFSVLFAPVLTQMFLLEQNRLLARAEPFLYYKLEALLYGDPAFKEYQEFLEKCKQWSGVWLEPPKKRLVLLYSNHAYTALLAGAETVAQSSLLSVLFLWQTVMDLVALEKKVAFESAVEFAFLFGGNSDADPKASALFTSFLNRFGQRAGGRTLYFGEDIEKLAFTQFDLVIDVDQLAKAFSASEVGKTTCTQYVVDRLSFYRALNNSLAQKFVNTLSFLNSTQLQELIRVLAAAFNDKFELNSNETVFSPDPLARFLGSVNEKHASAATDLGSEFLSLLDSVETRVETTDLSDLTENELANDSAKFAANFTLRTRSFVKCTAGDSAVPNFVDVYNERDFCATIKTFVTALWRLKTAYAGEEREVFEQGLSSLSQSCTEMVALQKEFFLERKNGALYTTRSVAEERVESGIMFLIKRLFQQTKIKTTLNKKKRETEYSPMGYFYETDAAAETDEKSAKNNPTAPAFLQTLSIVQRPRTLQYNLPTYVELSCFRIKGRFNELFPFFFSFGVLVLTFLFTSLLRL